MTGLKLRSLLAGAVAVGLLLVGTQSASSQLLEEYCDNQNSVETGCEPFSWIDIIITPGAVPQLVYRPRVHNPFGQDGSANGIGLREMPLGYISTAVGPVPTETEPRTYWLRSIENLSSTLKTVTYCTSGHTEPRCLTNSALAHYQVPPGQVLLLDDPASELPRNPRAFPPPPADRNGPYYLTTMEDRMVRGLVLMAYFNCADGTVNTCSN